MHEKLPPGITLIKADDFQTWLMDIQVIDSNPIYQGETYRLKFTFSQQYPIEVRPLPSPNSSPLTLPRLRK
jgi:ubiquitin-conjugating enzyme E2 W